MLLGVLVPVNSIIEEKGGRIERARQGNRDWGNEPIKAMRIAIPVPRSRDLPATQCKIRDRYRQQPLVTIELFHETEIDTFFKPVDFVSYFANAVPSCGCACACVWITLS